MKISFSAAFEMPKADDIPKETQELKWLQVQEQFRKDVGYHAN